MALIRPALIADCDDIGAVHVAAWRETYRGLLPDKLLEDLSVPVRAAMWRRGLERGAEGPAIFVAEEGGAIVGFAAGGARRSPQLQEDAEVYALYVLSAAQGRGLGRRLMAALATALAERGARSLCLWVLRDNAGARRYYERLGGRVGIGKSEIEGGQPIVEVAYSWHDLAALASGRTSE
jgi:ribosomal protein S18 acetylase RimI-like enzyme